MIERKIIDMVYVDRLKHIQFFIHSYLAILSILETELKDVPARIAAFSLFLLNRTLSLLNKL